MFQRSAWMITCIVFWVGLHPFLRIVVYPWLHLKSFIHGLEFISATLLVLQVVSLWTLCGWPRWRLDVRSWLAALLLFPLIWLLNALALWLLMEFGLLQEPGLEPLYDSQLFIRKHPLSWTGLAFLASAVLEEVFFRAWLPDYLERHLRKSMAIVCSALLFAVAHLSLHTSLLALLAYVFFALSLSYVRSFHGLTAAIGIHLLNNIVAFSSQAFQYDLFGELQMQGRLYLILFFLAAGFFLVGGDLRRLVDRGAGGP